MVKFLIIRFSSIGDIVLTTPVIRMLKQQVEGAEIHFLTKKQNLTVLEANPYIDHIHCYDKNMNELVKELKFLHLNYIIDLHNNIRSRKVRRELSLPAFSFNKINWEKWLLVHFKINKLPDQHIVDRYLETCSVFDIQNDQKGLDYFIPEKEEIDLKQLPVEFQQGYVGFVIGAQHATKKLPNDKIAAICSHINHPVILLGGPGDASNAEEIISLSQGKVYHGCGKFSLNQSASLVKQASAIVSHDTGLMHIAAAFQKNIVSVWGNTIPEFGMHPYLTGSDSKIAEVSDLKCRPCSKIGFSSCPKKHFDCMKQQNEKEIADFINDMLKGKN